MTTKPDGGPAYPATVKHEYYGEEDFQGMTLRDYFAGQALAGIVAGYWGNPDMGGLGNDDLARDAFSLADSMIAGRDQ